MWWKRDIERKSVRKGGFDPEFMELDMDFLVRAVKEAGIQAISGKLVGDVSLMDSIYWGEGWSWMILQKLSSLIFHRLC